MNHLDTFLQNILDNGGEGVILRDPTAPYQPGRATGYLKHKVRLPSLFEYSASHKPYLSQKFRDAEAKIVGSAGTYQWECEL